MQTIFILVKVDLSRLQDVAASLAKIPALKSVNLVTGEWDIVAAADLNGVGEVADLFVKQITPIEGIRKTTTLVSVMSVK